MKKFISFLVCFVMLLSFASVGFADDSVITVAINRDTITEGTVKTSIDSYQLHDGHIQIFQYAYVEYTVTVSKAARYSFDMHYGTNTDGVLVDVSVGGVTQIDNCSMGNTSSYTPVADKNLGKLDLSEGENVIRITAVENKDNDTVEWLLFSSATLTFEQEIVDTISIPTNSSNTDITVVNKGASNAGMYDGYMIMRGNSGNPTYITVPVDIKTAGWYGISGVVGTSETGFKLSIETDGQAIEKTFDSTGAYSKYVETYMDAVYLEKGTTTLNIAAVGGYAAAFVSQIKLQYLYDFSKVDFSAPVNRHTISSYYGGGANGGFPGGTYYYIVMAVGSSASDKTWFETKVHIDVPGYYKIGVSAGTSDPAFRMTVSNGDNSASKVIPSTGAYSTYANVDIGTLYLEKGTQTIRFAVNEWAGFVNGVTVTKENVYDFVIPVNADNKNITNYNNGAQNGGFDTSLKCMVMRAAASNNTWFEVPVYVDVEGWYKSTVLVGTTEAGYTLSLTTGEEVLSGEVEVTGGYTTFLERTLGTIYLAEGMNILRLTATNAAGLVKQLTLSCMEDYSATEILDVQVVNKDGVRMPYSLRTGMNTYANAKIKQIGTTSDKKTLLVAEYDSDGRLINAKSSIVDLSTVASGETKDFRTELTISDAGNIIKGFLLENESLVPAYKSASHQAAEIFTDEAIAQIKSKNINMTDATTLDNSSGTKYLDTGLHTEDYDITPIFYDGYNGSKIFAYIGIPTSASAENPVPAVVCVHGGAGQAYRSWVEEWNKRGFAAISMDMYGKAPEGEYSYIYNGVKSPYAGDLSAPWEQRAFSQNGDYMQGAMYQNVVNVMYAHNLLRSFDEIDSSKIGITGVSWGGITTTTTIGVDDRFVFAVPIYGCGYLDEGNTYFDSSTYFGTKGAIYWDPANFAVKAEMPVMYLNGNNDIHFSVKASSLTYGVTQNAYLAFYDTTLHSQVHAEGLEQAYRFAESIVSEENPFIKINDAISVDGVLSVDCTVPSETMIENVKLYYITEKEFPIISNFGDVNWNSVSEYSITDDGVSINVPDEATLGYVTITDNNENIMSSTLLKLK